MELLVAAWLLYGKMVLGGWPCIYLVANGPDKMACGVRRQILLGAGGGCETGLPIHRLEHLVFLKQQCQNNENE